MIKEVHYYDPTAKGDEIKTIYFCYCEECGALLYKRVFRDNLDIKRYFKEEHKPDCTEKDNDEIIGLENESYKDWITKNK